MSKVTKALTKPFKSLIGSKEKGSAAQEQERPVRAPNEGVSAKRSLVNKRKRGGRASTVLGQSETLG